jgi:hypothetical protein
MKTREWASVLALQGQIAREADERARMLIALAPAKRRAAAATARQEMGERPVITPLNCIRLRQARRLFGSLDAPRSARRSYMRQWARMVRALGDKWLGLAKPADQIKREVAS